MRARDRSARHFTRAVRLDRTELRRDLAEVEGWNAKIGVAITRAVGTMWMAYFFAAIALISFPAAISTGQVIIIVAWIAQTFLQLVLLSIIMVGQDVQARAGDTRAERTLADTERILARLDDLHAHIDRQETS